MLKYIFNDVQQLPTMMEIEEEIKIVQSLMNIPSEEFLKEKEIFFEILNRLETSHTQSIFSINPDNISHFKEFSKWLKILKKHFASEKDKNFLEGIADVMEATFF